ncbi:hypothetical protein EX30DRAFT_330437 [Ascodesmis nigricans]|uniref:DUF3752 domain-containing protein n=1 Tax=Ascodesmis nigricans TaxID=341454 RepID=A0A4S2MYP6_9PEZI|nr:hypothetical protein EX30DRAFT_330437 [Ascodesmis nigricans]
MSHMIGPSIPPEILEQRKRKAAEKLSASKPPTDIEIPPQEPEDSERDVKKRRTAGPAPPPAPLEEMPSHPPEPEDDSDSGDDDVGPQLPSAHLDPMEEERQAQQRLAKFSHQAQSGDASDGKPKRDEWMIVPPKSEDWAAKVDPTKLKNRKFNTGKSARGGAGPAAVSSIWTETPAEKRKRLEDEVMGRRKPATQGPEGPTPTNDPEAEETARRIREYNEKHRKTTLMDEHKSRAMYTEDDPSKRAFDREKDIAGGVKISNKQKKEMLDRASDFQSRFSAGKYL